MAALQEILTRLDPDLLLSLCGHNLKQVYICLYVFTVVYIHNTIYTYIYIYMLTHLRLSTF